jgi:ammonium transporter Rh
VCFFLTNKKTRAHPDNCSNYSSDTFAMLGSLFLMIMWPSFNAGIAPTDLGKVRAFWNTFISLCASSISTIIFSRLVTHQKLDMVHVQNSVLAGGVVMGVVADLELHPSTPIACGFAVGAISVFGYRYLTPFMTRHLHIQVETARKVRKC